MDQATIITSILVFGLLIAAAISYGTAFKQNDWKRPAFAAQGAILFAVAAFLTFHLIKHLIEKVF